MFDLVMDALKAIHGESIVYKGDGSLTHYFTGVFDETYVELDPDSGQRVSSESITILLSLADLPEQPAHRGEFLVRGDRYLIRHVEPDGQGAARIFLMEADT